MEWYYAKDGKQEGPVSAAQLRHLASAGKLDPTDMVFKIGSKDWVEASTISGLFGGKSSSVAASSASSAATASGFEFGSDGEKGAAVSARRKPARDRVEVEEDEDAPLSKGPSGGSFMDLLMFRRMIAPWVIMVLFWVGVLGSVVGGLIIIGSGFMSGNVMGVLLGLVGGLIYMPVGILFVRLYCELMIVIFRMNETLTDIKNVLERQRTA